MLSRPRLKHTVRVETKLAVYVQTKDPMQGYDASVKTAVSDEAILASEAGFLQRLEDELRAEIAASLGNTDSKLKGKMIALREAQTRLDEALRIRHEYTHPELESLVSEFNRAQDEAFNARQDLIIQRQAVGFRYNNYDVVSRLYPIPLKRMLRRSADPTETQPSERM